MLIPQHRLHVVFAQMICQCKCPVAESRQDLERLIIASIGIGVSKTSAHLVEHVPGCMHAVEADPVDIDIAVANLEKEALRVDYSTNVAIPVRALTLFKFTHYVTPSFDKRVSAGGAAKHGAGRKIVSEHATNFFLPSSVGLSFRCQPCGCAEIVQKAIRIK